MSQQAALQPLDGFQTLTDAIFFYSPPTAAPSGKDSRPPRTPSPDLIILATWFAAAPRHIAKYTRSYQRQYPSAQLLVLTSSMPDMTWRPSSAQRQRLRPAVAVLQAALAQKSGGAGARVLLHVFSNGGAQTACQFAGAFREVRRRKEMEKREEEGEEEEGEEEGRAALPVAAIAFDSCPGRPEVRRGADAMTAHLVRTPALRVVALVLLYPFLAFAWFYSNVLRFENVVETCRRELNDKSLFSIDAQRCYLYSKTDRMVWWKDIEAHADDAEKKGFKVEKVEFQNSAHAGHVLEDEGKYWGAIQRTLGGR